MEGIFSDIAIIIIVAAVLTIVFRFLKQPSILAYILTGVILGPVGIYHLTSHDALETFGHLGITLLLFILGLELRLRELKSIGKTAVIAGTMQMALTFILGLGLATLLGFSMAISTYIGIALSLSSTIIIIKLLSDKKDLNSLHGKLALGILLIQDFFHVLIIIFLYGSISGGTVTMIGQVGIVLLKILVLVGWILFMSEYVFPKLLRNISKSNESLFLFSLAWVFVVTAIVTSSMFGFPIEIGGFLAGLALANTAENYQIVARMKALRDFFVTIFFVILGLEMTFSNLSEIIVPAILFSLFALIAKPLVIMIITSILGYRKRTSFFVGTSLGQISEFSLIIFFIGNQKGFVPDSVVSMLLLVAIITFTGSTYLIQLTNKLYRYVSPYLGVLELRKGKAKDDVALEGEFDEFDKHVVIIGGHQMGKSIIHALKNSKEKILVVDFDPDVVKRLRDARIPSFFGDIADTEIQERAGFERAKLVISTVPDVEDNLLLIEGVTHMNRRAKIVVMALETEDAKTLYKAGADYVVMPHLAGGYHLAKILVNEDHLEMIERFKARDMEYLK